MSRGSRKDALASRAWTELDRLGHKRSNRSNSSYISSDHLCFTVPISVLCIYFYSPRLQQQHLRIFATHVTTNHVRLLDWKHTSSALPKHAMPPPRALVPLSLLSLQQHIPFAIAQPTIRHYSTTLSPSPPPPIDAKQLAHHRTRIGKCFFAGLPADQLERAGNVLKVLTLEWRELLAGSEGFLTERAKKGGGLWRRRVEWGDMVSVSVCVMCEL